MRLLLNHPLFQHIQLSLVFFALGLLFVSVGCQPAPQKSASLVATEGDHDEHEGDHDEHEGDHDEHEGDHDEHEGDHDEHEGDHDEHEGDHDEHEGDHDEHEGDHDVHEGDHDEHEGDQSSRPLEVMLGDPQLTAGIPGEGPLTTDAIKDWVSNPENHRTLQAALPMGLSGAASNITGLEENPLTLAKIELGRQLYFDTRLSADNTVSCATCHDPAEGYAKGTQFGVGIEGQTGNRNSPASYNRIVSGAQFWDGRADSLEAQAVGPIENPIEMGSTHDKCVETVGGIEGYVLQFDAVFGPNSVTIENVGKAIASFERTIVTAPAPYDFLEKKLAVERSWGDELDELEEEDPELYAEYSLAVEEVGKLSEEAIRGRELFFSEKSNCTACHAGANFSDEKYHNLGVGMEAEEPDPGRFAVTELELDRGAFKTPTCRNVALTAPYMHDGSQATLEEVVEWYAKGGHPNPQLSDKVKKLDLTDQDKKDLVAFMREALTSDFPVVATGRLPQ